MNHYRLFPYTGGCIAIPVLTLYGQHYEISLLATLIAIVLFFVDPVFKTYRRSLIGFSFFFSLSLAAGLILAAFSTMLPSYKGLIIFLWGFPTFIVGYRFASRLDKTQ
jgi:hypothetical protein